MKSAVMTARDIRGKLDLSPKIVRFQNCEILIWSIQSFEIFSRMLAIEEYIAKCMTRSTWDVRFVGGRVVPTPTRGNEE